LGGNLMGDKEAVGRLSWKNRQGKDVNINELMNLSKEEVNIINNANLIIQREKIKINAKEGEFKKLSEIMTDDMLRNINAEKEGVDLRYLEIADSLGIPKSRTREIDVYLLNLVHNVEIPIHKRIWEIYSFSDSPKEMCYGLYMFGIMMSNINEGRKL
jgi:hypothetical protein